MALPDPLKFRGPHTQQQLSRPHHKGLWQFFDLRNSSQHDQRQS